MASIFRRKEKTHPNDLMVEFKATGVDGSGNTVYAEVLALEPGSIGGGGTGSAVTIVDGGDVAQGTTTDLSSASTVVGILKAIKAAITGTLAVSGTFWQATQPVSGTFWQATQPVSLATAPSTPVTNAGTFAVQADTELPAAAALADASANPTTPSVGANGLLWNGTTWDRAPGTVAGGQYVQGAVASGVADTGSPVKVGGKYNLTQPTFVDGQRGDAQLDSRGNLRSSLFFGGVPNVAIANNDVQADGRNPANGTMAASDFGYLYSGASNTWDRERANWNGVTGDTGAKATGAFLGATQTNYNHRGAYITCVLGTVTGAVTTWQTGIQWSFDGGTTWLELTPLGANDTAAASGRTYTWIIYPTNTSQAAGTTPATLVPGTITVGGPTQLNIINAALPRTWRFAAQVSVVTSIAITSVNVNYIF